MIEKGQISKFTNNFMLSPVILQDIKDIYARCPKYCDAFVKTKFICRELLDCPKLRNQLREVAVRVVTHDNTTRHVSLEQQIRLLLKEAEDYIDLD